VARKSIQKPGLWVRWWRSYSAGGVVAKTFAFGYFSLLLCFGGVMTYDVGGADRVIMLAGANLFALAVLACCLISAWGWGRAAQTVGQMPATPARVREYVQRSLGWFPALWWWLAGAFLAGYGVQMTWHASLAANVVAAVAGFVLGRLALEVAWPVAHALALVFGTKLHSAVGAVFLAGAAVFAACTRGVLPWETLRGPLHAVAAPLQEALPSAWPARIAGALWYGHPLQAALWLGATLALLSVGRHLVDGLIARWLRRLHAGDLPVAHPFLKNVTRGPAHRLDRLASPAQRRRWAVLTSAGLASNELGRRVAIAGTVLWLIGGGLVASLRAGLVDTPTAIVICYIAVLVVLLKLITTRIARARVEQALRFRRVATPWPDWALYPIPLREALRVRGRRIVACALGVGLAIAGPIAMLVVATSSERCASDAASTGFLTLFLVALGVGVTTELVSMVLVVRRFSPVVWTGASRTRRLVVSFVLGLAACAASLAAIVTHPLIATATLVVGWFAFFFVLMARARSGGLDVSGSGPGAALEAVARS